MSEPQGVLPWSGGMIDASFSPFQHDMVEVSCRITVNGETLGAFQRVDALAWNGGAQGLREAIIAAVQQRCALEAIKRFPPEVTIRTP